MSRDEYKKKIKSLGIDLEALNLVLGSKTNIPFSTGCYYEEDNWILYSVDEKQNLSVIEKGTEQRIFKFSYMITLGRSQE